MDTWVVSNFCLLWTLLLWAWVYKYLFETLFTILSDIHTEVKLLHHICSNSFFFFLKKERSFQMLSSNQDNSVADAFVCLVYEHISVAENKPSICLIEGKWAGLGILNGMQQGSWLFLSPYPKWLLGRALKISREQCETHSSVSSLCNKGDEARGGQGGRGWSSFSKTAKIVWASLIWNPHFQRFFPVLSPLYNAVVILAFIWILKKENATY